MARPLLTCSFISIVFLISSFDGSAQSTEKTEQRPEWKAFYAKQSALRHRGTEILAAEDNLEKVDACKDAHDKMALDACTLSEFESTQQNYVEYVQSIGALLRLKLPNDAAAPPAPATLANEHPPNAGHSLDLAEALWVKYRQSQCSALGDYYWGGDIVGGAILDCRTRLTRRHIRDLADFYADLWH